MVVIDSFLPIPLTRVLLYPVVANDSGLLLCGTIIFGKYLEHRAKGKTSEAIKSLMGLQAKNALMLKDGKEIAHDPDAAIFERIFIWQGDYKLLMGIIKYVEDKKNIENDTQVVGVQAVILVEDDVKFYSTYLPLIYSQVFKQSQRPGTRGGSLHGGGVPDHNHARRRDVLVCIPTRRIRGHLPDPHASY